MFVRLRNQVRRPVDGSRMSLILYHNPISTCSQKVRLALAEKGLDYVSHVVDFARQDQLSDWYLAINPNGVVPSLVHDGQAVTDSSVICEYVDELYPEPPLGPPGPYGRAQMRAWMRYFEEVPTTAIRVTSFNIAFLKQLQAMGPARFASMTEKMPIRKQFYRQMGPEGFSQQTYNDSIDRLRGTLERVAGTLSDGRSFLLGDRYSIADILLVPTIVRMEDLGLSDLWEDLSEIAQWLSRVTLRRSFAVAFCQGARLDLKKVKL